MTARDTIALKPCPFCGGFAELMQEHDHAWIRHAGCPADLGGFEDAAGAIAAWNRRAEPAAGHRIVDPADMEAVPAGVLVPEEPTDDMLIAAHLEQTQPAIAYANNRARALAVWAAMLASRPKGGA